MSVEETASGHNDRALGLSQHLCCIPHKVDITRCSGDHCTTGGKGRLDLGHLNYRTQDIHGNSQVNGTWSSACCRRKSLMDGLRDALRSGHQLRTFADG